MSRSSKKSGSGDYNRDMFNGLEHLAGSENDLGEENYIEASDLLDYLYPEEEKSVANSDASTAGPPANNFDQDEIQLDAAAKNKTVSLHSIAEPVRVNENIPSRQRMRPLRTTVPAGAPAVTPKPASKSGFTVAEACDVLGLDSRSVLSLISIGELIATRDEDGQWLIKESSVGARLQSHGRPLFGTKPEEAAHVAPPMVETPRQPDPATNPIVEAQINAAPVSTTQELTGEEEESESLEILINSLDASNERMQLANHRIGFLEHELDKYQRRTHLLPDLGNLIVRLTNLEQDNGEIKSRLNQIENKRSRPNFLTRFFSLITQKNGRERIGRRAAKQFKARNKESF